MIGVIVKLKRKTAITIVKTCFTFAEKESQDDEGKG